MSCFLQPSQQHDLYERAYVQAIGGCVEADVGGDTFFCQKRVEGLPVIAVFKEASFGEVVEEV